MKIPYDWTKLSDQEIEKYISYFAKHHRKYKIERLSAHCILIDGVIKIERGFARGKGSYVKINNKYLYCDGTQEEIYYLADRLYNKLQRIRLTPIKIRANEWWLGNREVVITLCLVALVCGLAYWAFDALDKVEKRKQEKFKQEIIEGVLERFKQEQQKVNTSVQFELQNTK